MPVAELGNVQLYYETVGAGPPLLVIAGTAGDLRQPPGPFAWPGAQHFKALAYDHRGLGRSSAGTSPQPTMADYARDALALVDHLGWGNFSVLGVSFGGMVAQELALIAGGRLERMVLISTSAGGDRSSYPLHELYELPVEARTARLAELLDTRAAQQPELAAAIRTFLTTEHGLAAPKGPSRGLLRQLEARRRHDTSGRLEAIACPVLVAAGRFDGIAPPVTAEYLAAQLPDCRLRFFDGGHGQALLLQDARAWPEIVGFLTEE